MKKSALISVCIITGFCVSMLCVFVFNLGFVKNTNVIVDNFSVSEDGSVMHLKVTTTEGYIRAFENYGGEINSHRLLFYSGYGRARDTDSPIIEFDLSVENQNEIYFNRARNKYELVLKKNPETGIWERP